RRVRPQIRGHFLSLILQNRRAHSLQRVVVLQREAYRFVERNLRRRVRGRGRRARRRCRWRQWRHFLPLAYGQRGQSQKRGPRQTFPHEKKPRVSRGDRPFNQMELQRKGREVRTTRGKEERAARSCAELQSIFRTRRRRLRAYSKPESLPCSAQA